MKNITLILCMFTSLQSNASNLNEICDYIQGSTIISSDNYKKYLGKIISPYDNESVFNKYGNFGSKYSSNSIWNNFSKYGNTYNNYSPFNTSSSNPPILIKNNRIIAKLTVNNSIPNALNPYMLKNCKF